MAPELTHSGPFDRCGSVRSILAYVRWPVSFTRDPGTLGLATCEMGYENACGAAYNVKSSNVAFRM